MTLIEKQLLAAFSGEPIVSYGDEVLPALLSELREMAKSAAAQRSLGTFAMSMMTSRLTAEIRTAKAIGAARTHPGGQP